MPVVFWHFLSFKRVTSNMIFKKKNTLADYLASSVHTLMIIIFFFFVVSTLLKYDCGKRKRLYRTALCDAYKLKVVGKPLKLVQLVLRITVSINIYT